MTSFSVWRRRAALAALLGSIVFTAGNVQAGAKEPPGLFSEVAGNSGMKLPEKAIKGKSRAVKVNRGQLRSGRILVNLPGDISLEAVRELQQELGQNRFAWVGHASGDKREPVVIGVSGEAVAATFAYKGKLYKLEPRPDGSHVVSEVEPGDPAPGLDPIPVADTGGAGSTAAATTAFEGGPTIDVLVAYTPKILSIYGAAGADALIIQAVAEANRAYANSGITARLNLVRSVLTNYTESGDMNTDLGRLAGTGDGYMDELHALRDSTGADMVSLIEDAPQYCGIAYLMGNLSPGFAASAFSVIHRTCATGYYSFAHELGHNQGAHHDPANAGGAMYPYAYGYQEPFGAFRTVMAYNCSGGCTRVDHFSNPDVLYNGQPTGASGLSDNARTINTNAATVANFRQQAPQNAPSAPTGLDAAATGHSTVSLGWTDTSAEESGFNLERSDNGVDFTVVASLPANSRGFEDDNLEAETLYYYRVQAWNSVGNSAYSNTATAATGAAPPFVEQVASADMPVAGTVSGSFQDTWRAGDGSVETIREQESGGKKSKRYGYLEHKWVLNVVPATSVILTAQVTTSASSDSFTFAYSTDNSNFKAMFTVNAGNAGAQQFVLPAALSGTLYIRVRDNTRQAGDLSSHSVQVDQLMVRSDNEPGETIEPPAPAPAPPPPPAPAPSTTANIELGATPYLIGKNNKRVDLSWSGAQSSTVDIYRNGALLVGSTSNDGSHTDNLSRNAGDNHSYQVCEAGTVVCSGAVGVGF